MKGRFPPRLVSAAICRVRLVALLVVCSFSLAGCAAIPTSSPVTHGVGEIETGGAVGMIAQGPIYGQGPEELMRGFLLAAQAGPTASAPFMLAKEYLTPEAARNWRPMAGVTVLDGAPHLEITGGEATPDLVHGTAFGMAVATVNDDGEYQEFEYPVEVTSYFTLQRTDGNWRISDLDDGVLLPAQVFSASYIPTRIYRPSADARYWVTDVRWFPGATWRTNAVQTLFDGAPPWLQDAVLPAAPESAALQLAEVEAEPGGGYVVSVQGNIRDASAHDRVLLRAQLAATLLGDPNNHNIYLVDTQGSIPVPDLPVPLVARTSGSARVLADGEVWQVHGRDLITTSPPGLVPDNPTGFAFGQGDNQAVVWRVGDNSIVRTYFDDTSEPTTQTLFEGVRVLAPSMDPYGFVWTGESDGALQVISPAWSVHKVTARWLAGQTVMQIRVSAEGARLALVTQDATGIKLVVAGIIRDGTGTPIGLAAPLVVGGSLHDISAVAWHDDATLAVIGTTAGVRGAYLVGIGGLNNFGGLPRRIPGLEYPKWITASVGSGNILGIDNQGKLHLREAMSLWPLVGPNQTIDLVAYPG